MQKERYIRVRRRSRKTPRALARLVRRCLRAKARNRPGTAGAVRRALESRVGVLSPADVRAELARWLWERQLFDRHDGETVVLVAARAPAGGPRRWGWLPGMALAAAICASILLIDLEPRGRPDPETDAAENADGAPEAGADSQKRGNLAGGGGKTDAKRGTRSR